MKCCRFDFDKQLCPVCCVLLILNTALISRRQVLQLLFNEVWGGDQLFAVEHPLALL